VGHALRKYKLLRERSIKIAEEKEKFFADDSIVWKTQVHKPSNFINILSN